MGFLLNISIRPGPPDGGDIKIKAGNILAFWDVMTFSEFQKAERKFKLKTDNPKPTRAIPISSQYTWRLEICFLSLKCSSVPLAKNILSSYVGKTENLRKRFEVGVRWRTKVFEIEGITFLC